MGWLRTLRRALPVPCDERWTPAVYPYQDAAIPPRSLWVGPSDPLSHFLRWPHEYLAYLTILCSMRRDSVVLELGCDHGRTALGILDYIRPPGRYTGLDIRASHVEFATRHITPMFPHFRFVHADLVNRLYNPGGRGSASEYVFPLDDASVDVAYGASLFTHLLPADVDNYLKQSARVLKPGGCCLYSFFVADFYRGPGTVTSPLFQFEHALPGHAGVLVRDPEVPESLLAYPSKHVHALAERHGLQVERTLPGLWSNTSAVAHNEHDLLLLRKP